MSDSPTSSNQPISKEEFNIGPLSWVKREIQFALARADESITQFSVKPEDHHLARITQNHLHQVTGALRMVGLDSITLVSTAIETLIDAFIKMEIKVSREGIGVIHSAIKALNQYIENLMRGERNRPLVLYPVYRAVLTASEVKTANAVDLFFPNLLLKPDFEMPPSISEKDFEVLISAKRSEFQKGLLQLLRGNAYQPALLQMQAVALAIEKTQLPVKRILWWIAVGFLEGLASSTTPPTPFHKQLCGRLDIEIKHLLDESGHQNIDRLLRELLFAVAYMQPMTPRLRKIHNTYELTKLLPIKREDNPEATRVKMVLHDLKRELEAVKEAWSHFTSGNPSALTKFALEAAQLSNFAQSFDNKSVKKIFSKLVEVGNELTANPKEPDDALALEVATLLITAKDALEHYDHLGTDFNNLTQTAVVRVSAALKNRPLPPGGNVAADLIDVTRTPQEKKLFFQLGQESLNNLNRIEEILDAFFRKPSNRDDLAKLESYIKQLEGVMAMLESKAALMLLTASRALIQKFVQTDGNVNMQDAELAAEAFSSLGLLVVGIQQGYENPDELLHPVLERFNIKIK